jgi:transcriptional regulator with XRE-family HTH domain
MSTRTPPPKLRLIRGEARKTLRQLREGAKLSQEEMAEKLGTGQAQISRLEHRNDMSLSTLRRYAHALGAECEIAFVFSKPHRHRVVLASP